MAVTFEEARAGALVMGAFECAPHCDRSTPASDACSYRVAWSINPHMIAGTVDRARARTQHAALGRLLTQLGAHVFEMPFVHGAFDSVFSKDNAVLLHRGAGTEALLTQPAHGVRLAEQGPRARMLAAMGFFVRAPPATTLEGGDVVVLPGARGAFLGHGFRSSRRSARVLERFLDAPVIPVELVDPRLYHLDMAVCVLGDGTALVCEAAITPASRAAIARAPGVRRVVRVSLEEALRFGVNVVQVGRAVVLGGNAPSLAASLRDLGWRTHSPALDQFHLAGGSAACLVARIHLPDRIALASVRPTAA